MPTIAASTPSMSLTCGRRMKLPIPVKRGAFIASTGRYRRPVVGFGSGTRQLRFDSFHALFVDDSGYLVAQLSEPLASHHVEGPRPRQIDDQRGADAARPVGHHIDH